MSPQLLWTIAGLILTVLTLGGVSISSYQSLDSATAKLLASETGNIATAGKLWITSKSTDGTFNGINAEGMATSIPDLTLSGTGATSTLASKAGSGVTYTVASTSPYSQVVITVNGLTSAQADAMHQSLNNKACTSTHTAGSTGLTYTCNG